MTIDIGATKLDPRKSAATSGATRHHPTLWGGALLAAASAILYLLNTRHGIGILPDSTRYMGLDVNPYDAPLYAWILQGLAATGLRIEAGAKIFGLLVVCANSFLIWQILLRATVSSLYAGIGTAIVIFSPHFVWIHALAMSEPTFILFFLITLMTLSRFLDSEKRIWLVACGLAIGLTTLVRFTGVALGAAVAAFLLIRPNVSLAQRFSEASAVGAISGAIFGIWAIAAKLLSGQAVGRDLEFYGNLEASQWLGGLNTLSAHLMPAQIPLIARIALLVLIVIGIAYLGYKYARSNWQNAGRSRVLMLITVLGSFFVFYIAFVVLSANIEANLFLTGRYGFPVYVTTAMLTAIVLANTGQAIGYSKYLSLALAGLAIIILVSHTVRTVVRTRTTYLEGVGYASVAWSTSPTLQAINKLPPNSLIYSNGADVIAYVLRRSSRYIPRHFNLRTGLDDPNTPLTEQVEGLRSQLSSAHGFVVFLDRIDWRFYLVTEEELQKLLNLVLVTKEADGRIYALPDNQ